MVFNLFSKAAGIAGLFIKPLKYWIDDWFREKVRPVEGSVVYSDLWFAVEHSGIYTGDNKISNIAVTGFAQSKVKIISPRDFVSSGKMYSKIYVSCNGSGAVGDHDVSNEAASRVGERDYYLLAFKNCHDFSRKCLYQSTQNHLFDLDINDLNETWEPTIGLLKATAKIKIGATKWKLWDWQNDKKRRAEKPDINKIIDSLKNEKLTPEMIDRIKKELEEAKAYKNEISDEKIPPEALEILESFSKTLDEIDKQCNSAKEFLKLTGHSYSFNQLKELAEDFSALANEMARNRKITEIVEKLGKNYISEIKKRSVTRVDKRGNNEVFGIRLSDDLERMLPSELINLENEELEYLFYSRYLEKRLLTYELIGKSKEQKDEESRKKGPAVACIDTSGSMDGIRILKAKALLLAVANILEKENRSLYVILFGASGETRELNIEKSEKNSEILKFLKQGFGGGTDFDTPIEKSIEIIESIKGYNKADILMITDGLCQISNDCKARITEKRKTLDFNIYTIICSSDVIKDDFSDEILNI
ncbi:MAG TPA: VWA domain-containing protein [Candidatus Wallbacteria bacterium]|nr:MAG: hypothetical protein BWY32_03361 [bacterium ADurb.Bin243]HPG58597.1 VWA domain-containing protein [Candidatus Wallbacteria bacterium]